MWIESVLLFIFENFTFLSILTLVLIYTTIIKMPSIMALSILFIKKNPNLTCGIALIASIIIFKDSKLLTIIGFLIAFYALIYNALSAEHSARIAVISSLTGTAMSHLKDLKSSAVALEATHMPLPEKPMPWQPWNVFMCYKNLSDIKKVNSTPSLSNRLKISYNKKSEKFTIIIDGENFIEIDGRNKNEWDAVYRKLGLRVETIRDIRATVEALAKNHGFVPKKVANAIEKRINDPKKPEKPKTITEIIQEEFDKEGIHKANLYGLWLHAADLRGADLFGADLTWAKLTGAKLTGADLFGADLFWADLRGAKLTGANLFEADLTGADLFGAFIYELENGNFKKDKDGNFIKQTLLEHIQKHNGIPADLGFPSFTGVKSLDSATFHEDQGINKEIISVIKKYFNISS